MSKAGSQRRRLAGTRAGEDKHWAFRRQHGLALRRVQALQICRLSRWNRGFRHLAEVGQQERIGNQIAGLFGAGTAAMRPA